MDVSSWLVMSEDETSFYSNAEGYWRDVPPTVDGMLGGYGNPSPASGWSTHRSVKGHISVLDFQIPEHHWIPN
uniref:Uncharacterized protein n=1 Tax=Oryzias sinensis TaxID=183150 RepID=A0A8C7WTA3_9TELE